MGNSMGSFLGLVVALTLLSSAHAFDCKRYTVKQIEISGNQTGNMSEIFRTTKDTQRCSAVYKLDNTTCSSMQPTCGRWYLPNKKGDSFITKPAAKNNTVEQPRIWCKREGPSENFPSLSPYGNLKVWYKRSTGQLGTGRFPKKGVRCSVSC